MENYLIFAGTTEGRELTQFLLNMINEEHLQMHLTVCIATDYGRLMLPEHKALTVLASRLNEQEMEKLEIESAHEISELYSKVRYGGVGADRKLLKKMHDITR